jgi:hypothetical protein
LTAVVVPALNTPVTFRSVPGATFNARWTRRTALLADPRFRTGFVPSDSSTVHTDAATRPVTLRSRERWNDRTARVVATSKRPCTRPWYFRCFFSRHWAALTWPPVEPRFSTR